MQVDIDLINTRSKFNIKAIGEGLNFSEMISKKIFK